MTVFQPFCTVAKYKHMANKPFQLGGDAVCHEGCGCSASCLLHEHSPHTMVTSLSHLLNFVPCKLGTQWKEWQTRALAATSIFPVPELFFKHIHKFYLFSWLPKLTSCPQRGRSRVKSSVAPNWTSVLRAHLWQGVGEKWARGRHLCISSNICWPV